MHLEWATIGPGLFCPAVVSLGSGDIALFARVASGELICQQKSSAGWGVPASWGVPVAQTEGAKVTVPVGWQLAACADAAEPTIDLVANSPDGDLLHLATTVEGSGTFVCLGAPAAAPANRAIPFGLASPPAVCRSTPDRIDVFALAADGEILHAVCNADGWGPFDSLGVPPSDLSGTVGGLPSAEAVAACACGSSRMAVFRRGVRNDLLLKWWDGKRWSDYASLGAPEIPDESYPAVTTVGPITGPPAACSWGPTRLDVFARGPYGDLVHTWWDGSDWSGFTSLGMPVTNGQMVPFTGMVTACSADVNSCDVVAGAMDGRLYHLTWNHCDNDA